MGLEGIIGPALIILAIFALSYASDIIAAKGKGKYVDQEERRSELKLREREMELKHKLMDFERAKLEKEGKKKLSFRKDESLPLGSRVEEASFKELEYKEDEDDQ